jgi:hypothetical protein
MNPLEIPELLLRIFYFGSESDTIGDEGLGSPPSIPHGYSHPRSPKPFFRSIIRVRKNWKQIVQSVPSFWVTKVSFKWNSPEGAEMGLVRTGLSLLSPGDKFTAAEELLNGSNGSDIDFCFSFTWLSNPEVAENSILFDDVEQWMDTHIFSASNRIRQLSFFSCDDALFERVLKCSFSRSWPRLRTLNLEATEQIPEMSQTFNAPQLSFASFKNVSWIEDQFGLANNSLSSLHINHHPEEMPDDEFQSCTVMTYLSQSLLFSLTELKLELYGDERQEHLLSTLPPSLSFARLKRLSLENSTAEDIWHFLKCIDAPLLSGLYISTISLTESGTPNEVFPQRFPLLEDMGFFFITPSWAAVFLRLVPTRHNRLSTLSLHLQYMGPADKTPRAFDAASLREEFFPQPMELPNLRNLFFKLETIEPWFFTSFNLETTTDHLFLDYYSAPKALQTGPLLFPNVTKMTVHRRRDLTLPRVVTPALRHLILDLPNDERGISVSKRLREGRTPFVTDDPLAPCGSNIPLDSLETLEIGCIWISNPKLFAPFNSIHTLVISAKQLLTIGAGRLRIPGVITEVRTAISEPVLPNLHTLGLCFEYFDSSFPDSESLTLTSDHYEVGLRLAQAFMRRRLDEGNPVQTLRIIGFLPKVLESGPEFTWLRDASGAKIEFARRKDDFALRLMSPY